MDIIGKKYYYFAFSGIVVGIGLIFIIQFGLLFSIDFTGGSNLEIGVNNVSGINKQVIQRVVESSKVRLENIKIQGSNSVVVRTEPIDQKTKTQILTGIQKEYKDAKEKSFETVGPSIGRETESNALKAVLIASIAITLYIAFAFREVSKPVASWKFGVCAIAALLHDVLVVVGIFAILGHFFGAEVDSLFITALLTIMGFSVHDTIVVFDRIRENLKKNIGLSFGTIVNNSILETLNRSLNTSLTVVLVLLIMLIFGGESIRWFIVALLLGIISGTYSSIFNASQLLVVWHDWDKKRIKK